jgi:hypothetical protein
MRNYVQPGDSLALAVPYGNDPDQVMATGPLNATSGAGVTVVDRLYLRPFR